MRTRRITTQLTAARDAGQGLFKGQHFGQQSDQCASKSTALCGTQISGPTQLARQSRLIGAIASPNLRAPLPKTPPSERILVSLDALRPTQSSVGMRAVAMKRRKIEKRLEVPKRIARFLEDKPIPSVRGPGGHLFMIDHHHLGLALWQAEIDTAYVYVIDDLSVLPVAAFWQRMEDDGRVYPFDAQGRRIKPSRLPSRINALNEDSFRDLAWSVREAGGFAKTRTPFAEFLWADYFRDRVPERLVARDYEAAVSRALKLARAKAACDLPGWRRAT